ncbi:hypothetical protein GCM10020254_09680 [Streptomyces goshikiensis]
MDLSQSCSWLARVLSRSEPTIELMLSFSSATSPEASTVMERVRSPSATALATSAMARTLAGEVPGEFVDVLGQALPGAGDSLDLGLAAEPALAAHLPGHPGDLGGEGGELVDHRVDGGLQLQDLAAGVHVDLLGQIAVGDGRRHEGDVADLAREVVGHGVDVVGQVLPGSRHVGDPCLAAEPALGADLTRDAGDLVGERGQRVDHRVDDPGQRGDLALRLHHDLLRQVAAGDGGGHLGDRAHLAGQVGGHHVDVVGEVLPGPGDAPDRGLATQVALGADLPGDAGDLVGERGELVDHRVDGLLQLQDLSPGVHSDLLRQVALRHGGGDLGDRADLGRQVVGHDVDRFRQVLPGAGDTLDVGLAAEPALGADLPGDAGDLAGESGELVDHRVDGLLQLQDLPARGDVDLLGEIALGHGGRDLGDGAHLGREVPGHEIDRIGEVQPGSPDPGDVRLAAQGSLGAHLAGHPGHLGGEQRQLVDHPVEDRGDLAEQPVRRVGQPGAEVPVAYGCEPGQQQPQFRLADPCPRAAPPAPRSVNPYPPARPSANPTLDTRHPGARDHHRHRDMAERPARRTSQASAPVAEG